MDTKVDKNVVEKKKSGNKEPRPFNYVPYFIVGSVLYFIFTIALLLIQDLPLISTIIGSLMIYVLVHGVILFLAKTVKIKLEKYQQEQEKLLQNGGSNSQGKENPDFRKEAWIVGLKREAWKKREQVLHSIAGVITWSFLFAWIIMPIAKPGIMPLEVFIFPLPVVIIFWVLIIALFPRGQVFFTLFVVSLFGIGYLMIGDSIFGMIAQLAFLPVFYLLMMFFMYGSMMLPSISQNKFLRPGQGDWEVRKGSTRGQFRARSVFETQVKLFKNYSHGKSDRKSSRGILAWGPPGVGKTLLAKEIASDPELHLPFIFIEASSLNTMFMGMSQLVVTYIKSRVESLAKEFGGAVVFIDECETVFGVRSGMPQTSQFARDVDLYDVWDNHSSVVMDAPQIRARKWYEEQMALDLAPKISGKHSVFMMPGGMGGNSAIFPFLTWMSGIPSAPFMAKAARSTINTILDAFFIPVTIFGKVLRLTPAKAKEQNILFIGATNRPWMIDPAMRRPGRFGVWAEFTYPDEDERYDTAEWYLKTLHRKGRIQDYLITPEFIREFAQSTPNRTQAEIEMMIGDSVEIRIQHVELLRRCKQHFDSGLLDKLTDSEQQTWKRYKNTVYDRNGKEIQGWDDVRVDRQTMMISISETSHGRKSTHQTSIKTRINVCWHELGHLFALFAFNRKQRRPTVITVEARDESLGMVAHIPLDSNEQYTQEFYDGVIRVSVASWVTEHVIHGQNLPGVTGDLRNASNVACLMVGKFGMGPHICSEEEEAYFAKIGDTLLPLVEASMFSSPATALPETVLRDPQKRHKVSIILGQAAIDAYHLVINNLGLFVKYVPELISLGEFSGNKLSEVWQGLETELVTLDHLNKRQKSAKPQNNFAVFNPFLTNIAPEGKVSYDQALAKIEGVS